MSPPTALRTVTATRYVAPLREGGSLPAIVEADDDGMYVMKFRGAGQGEKALCAELLSGEIARALGLRVPEIVFAQLDAALGRTEPDDEIRDLIKASAGVNLALDYLPGSLGYDPLAPPPDLDARLASMVVWLDAFVTNVDRSARNTNLLQWHQHLWLIDHGATLLVHHDWSTPESRQLRARSPFAAIATHVLLARASDLRAADAQARAALDEATIAAIVALLPDEWLQGDTTLPSPLSPDDQRAAYLAFFGERLAASHLFIEEAERARARLV